ncbi:MAG: HK97-gp10 family putative phage morphogenesis protein [Planctomycetota bacterium]
MLNEKLEENIEASVLVEQIHAALRNGEMRKALKAAGKLVVKDARPRIAAPGYTGDKPERVPLRKTLKTVVRERDSDGSVYAVVGTTWPDGAHGHLVEFGHVATREDGTTVHVPPNPFLRPAVDATADEQRKIIIHTLRAAAQSVAKKLRAK